MLEVKIKTSLASPVFSKRNKLVRTCWGVIYHLLFKLSPVPFFAYRRSILRLFGAKIGSGVNIYPSVKIWLPSNLELKARSSLGPRVQIYNQGRIVVCEDTIVSQGAYLCASTHDYNNPLHPLLLEPINVEKNTWICADAFVGPGVTIAEGSVVGARAVVMKSTENWGVYGGNPAIKLSERKKFD